MPAKPRVGKTYKDGISALINMILDNLHHEALMTSLKTHFFTMDKREIHLIFLCGGS